MKKQVLLFCIITVFSLHSLNAEKTQNDPLGISIGGGAGYHFEEEKFGMILDISYFFTDDIRLSFGLLFYPESLIEGYDNWAEDFNFNKHYLLIDEANTQIYALFGVNLYRDIGSPRRAGLEEIGVSNNSSDVEIVDGINLGGGIEYNIGSPKASQNAVLFSEIKLTTGNVHNSNFLMHGGIRYSF